MPNFKNCNAKMASNSSGARTTDFPPVIPGSPRDIFASTELKTASRSAMDAKNCAVMRRVVPCAHTPISSMYKYNCISGHLRCHASRLSINDMRSRAGPKTEPAMMVENRTCTEFEKQPAMQMKRSRLKTENTTRRMARGKL